MMRRLLILGALTLALGCEKKTEPTTTAPSGWSSPPIADAERSIDGTWIVDREADDEDSRPAEANWNFTFKEGTLSITRNKEVNDGSYRLNTSANPKEIDLTTIEEGKAILLKGLYEFRGDKLVLIMPSTPSSPRPSGIKKPEKKRLVYILELIRKP